CAIPNDKRAFSRIINPCFSIVSPQPRILQCQPIHINCTRKAIVSIS
ncbi:capsular associated protein, partial [Moniliophthora roreri]